MQLLIVQLLSQIQWAAQSCSLPAAGYKWMRCWWRSRLVQHTLTFVLIIIITASSSRVQWQFCFISILRVLSIFVISMFFSFTISEQQTTKIANQNQAKYYQMVVDERCTKPLTRPLLLHASTVETRSAPELHWDAPCCDVVSSSLPIQRPANILWWPPSSFNHPRQWWSSWHLLWQLITLPIFRQWQSFFREKLQPIIIWTEEIAIIGSVQSQMKIHSGQHGAESGSLKAHLIFIFLPGFGPMYVMCSTQSVHLSETSWMQWLHTLPLTCSDSKHELCCDTSCKE